MVINFLIAGGVAFAAAGAPPSSAANANGTAGTYAATAINEGHLAEAERILRPESREDADDPARLVNIATVYARTQRYAQAREALRRVSALPAEQLELADGGSYSSHAIARAMLTRLDRSTQLTAR